MKKGDTVLWKWSGDTVYVYRMRRIPSLSELSVCIAIYRDGYHSHHCSWPWVLDLFGGLLEWTRLNYDCIEWAWSELPQFVWAMVGGCHPFLFTPENDNQALQTLLPQQTQTQAQWCLWCCYSPHVSTFKCIHLASPSSSLSSLQTIVRSEERRVGKECA